MRSNLMIGRQPLTISEVVGFAHAGVRYDIADDQWAVMQRTRDVVDDHARRGVAVYGLTTGLGSNVSQRVVPSLDQSVEERVVLGRLTGIGEPLNVEICRSALLIRINGLTLGAAGVSPNVVQTLLEMMNADVIPAVPSYGSIGASDLGPCAAIAACAFGQGRTWVGGKLVDAAKALEDAGIQKVILRPKDALGLINSNAVTLARLAHLIDELRRVLQAGLVASASSFTAFGGNPSIFRHEMVVLRPLPSSVELARFYRFMLDGSWIWVAGDDRLPQNALSFRTLVPMSASVIESVRSITELCEIEINSIGDNPAVLPDSAEILSTPHFHTSALALAGDALSVALTHWATASAYRSQKLINPINNELPRFLSPVGGSSVGFNALQKTIAALHAGIRLRAQPASCDSLAISEGVEDIASQLPLVIDKFDEQVQLLENLVSIEALVACHANSLRSQRESGKAAKVMSAIVGSVIPPFINDRALGVDVERVVRVLREEPSQRSISDLVESGWAYSPLSRSVSK